MAIEYKINGNVVSRKEFVKYQEQASKQRMEDMLEAQEFGGMMTDDVFLAGLPQIQHMHNKAEQEYICRKAKEGGYTPKPTDVYQPGLARYKGDPRAFVNHGQARGHVRHICESEGRACEGAVNVEAREPEADPWDKPKHKLSPRLIKEMAQKQVAADPKLARLDKRELVEKVVAEHGPQGE